jgi:hypothetical protein
MAVMSNQAINVSEVSLRLKEPCGWFAAGASFGWALRALSDGAFRLFAYLCLEADRRTGCHEAVQGELAKALGKSRRIVGKYIEELEAKQVCVVRSAKNQYGRTRFEIRDEYWPYLRMRTAETETGRPDASYIDTIKSRFVALGCTVGKFSTRDMQCAQALQRRGVPLETVQDALLVGAVRKYISWLNGGSPQPIASLAYFAAVVSEIQERPFPADYREYLRMKIVQLAKAWAEEAVKGGGNGGCPDMAHRQIVQ